MGLRHVVYTFACAFAVIWGAGPALADPPPGQTVDLHFTGTIADGSAYDTLLGQSFADTLPVTLDFLLQYDPGSTFSPDTPSPGASTLSGAAPGSVSPIVGGTVTFGNLAALTFGSSPAMSSSVMFDPSGPEYYVTWTSGSNSMSADFFSSGLPSTSFALEDFFTPIALTNGDGLGTFGFTAHVGEVSQNFFDTVSLDGMSVSFVPEPASWVLFLVAFSMVGWAMRSHPHKIS
jgi:hypothetical protein